MQLIRESSEFFQNESIIPNKIERADEKYEELKQEVLKILQRRLDK